MALDRKALPLAPVARHTATAPPARPSTHTAARTRGLARRQPAPLGASGSRAPAPGPNRGAACGSLAGTSTGSWSPPES